MPARRRTPAPTTTFRGAPAARQRPARVHPWGLRRAAAFRASGRARSSARYSGGIAPTPPDATVGRASAFMQPPAGALQARKRVVAGKSVYVRVDLGDRRVI